MADPAESDIFNEEPDKEREPLKPEDNDGEQTAGDHTAEAFAEYVGEGKKYKTVDDFVKGFQNAQQFIEQLKTENEGLRGELKTNEKLDALLDSVRASRQDDGDRDEGERGKTTSSAAGKDEATTQEQINKLVRSEVTRIEQERSAQQNESEASTKLVEVTGSREDATKLVKQAASELGVSVTYLRQQAQISPTAFLRMVTATTRDPAGTPRGGSHNAEALASRRTRPEGRHQPQSYFRKLRAELPKSEYYSPQVQNRLMESRAALGDAFYDE